MSVLGEMDAFVILFFLVCAVLIWLIVSYGNDDMGIWYFNICIFL